jgi:Uma2 family endonuclease
VTRSTNWLVRSTGPDIWVSTQNPIRIPEDSEPQPDIVVQRAAYDEELPPTPSDIFLVIEVADSSLEYDRNIKLPRYAEAGIPEAWLFNLVANRIERHTEPSHGGSRTVAYAEAAGQQLPSTILPDLRFDAAELLGLRRLRR